MTNTRGWVLVVNILRQLPPADELIELRDAGAKITRNSRAEWIADPSCPLVQNWLRRSAAR